MHTSLLSLDPEKANFGVFDGKHSHRTHLEARRPITLAKLVQVAWAFAPSYVEGLKPAPWVVPADPDLAPSLVAEVLESLPKAAQCRLNHLVEAHKEASSEEVDRLEGEVHELRQKVDQLRDALSDARDALRSVISPFCGDAKSTAARDVLLELEELL
jgi:hypothetical protein